MTRYFHLLETHNRFANGDLWRGRARGAGAGVRGHADCGSGMTRLLLVAAVATVVMLVAAGVVSGAESHVYPGGSIQDAIDGAGAGDTIYVHAGTYVENVDVDKRITLIGDGANVMTVTAADAGDHVFEVTADYVGISGFTATGATGSASGGIYLSHVCHCNISESNASNNNYGIGIDHSNNNLLANNIANLNKGYGIRLYYSSDNTLTGNTASNNDNAEYLDTSSIYLWYSNNNTLTENTANSNDHHRGIHLYRSSDNTLTGNNVSDNNYGIAISNSNNNTFYHNNIEYNAYDDGTNQWDSGSEGNYWSDYNGTDNNTDGIGDDPHLIPGGTSIDRFPLMQPWTGGTSPKGDLNHDNQITADAAIALRIAATGAHDDAADVSGDGQVTSLDALTILKAAGRVTKL